MTSDAVKTAWYILAAAVTGGVAMVDFYDTALPYAAEQNAIAAIQRTLTDNRDAKGTSLRKGALAACEGSDISITYKSSGAEALIVSDIVINNALWNLDKKTEDCKQTIESVFFKDDNQRRYSLKIDGSHNSYLLSKGEMGDEWHRAKFFVTNGKFDQTTPQPPSIWQAYVIEWTNDLTGN
jgi:hypothetical protein